MVMIIWFLSVSMGALAASPYVGIIAYLGFVVELILLRILYLIGYKFSRKVQRRIKEIENKKLMKNSNDLINKIDYIKDTSTQNNSFNLNDTNEEEYVKDANVESSKNLNLFKYGSYFIFGLFSLIYLATFIYNLIDSGKYGIFPTLQNLNTDLKTVKDIRFVLLVPLGFLLRYVSFRYMIKFIKGLEMNLV